MRIPKSSIPVLAKVMAKELLSREMLELKISEDQFVMTIAELILEELMVEDRLNEEVREILKKYDSEIEAGRLDYRRVFDLTKQKLIKDRNIII